ncbi:hypothetical protein [Pelomonas cellulosilytica]|uniref:Secreted protein n=1 Tax=Pelomonas cellulosilytica TaxID=2906762 RepID=A0ABS8XWR8_9BURK|nr:hypothetical protein [Pelomonas sp. P8]MCE4557102.1 hypothetical protein [Pelomonas sp. P8]
MKRLLIALLPATLIGCAGTPPVEEQQAAAVEPGTRCEREQSTGSHMISVRCRTPAQQAQDKRDIDAMQEATRHVRSVEMKGKGG